MSLLSLNASFWGFFLPLAESVTPLTWFGNSKNLPNDLNLTGRLVHKHLFWREKTKMRLKMSSLLYYYYFFIYLHSACVDQVSSLICSDPRFEGLRLPQTPPILTTDVYYMVSLYTGTHAKTHTQTQTQISVLNVDRQISPCVGRACFLQCGLLQLWGQNFGLHNILH